MRNFLAFIRRFRVLLFFALLQGIALTMYFTFLSFPRTQYMTTASSVSGSIFEARNEVTQFLDLRKNNTSLQKENARLRGESLQSLLRLENGMVKVDDTLHMVQYEYIPAKIINSTFTKRNNYFTLDIGSLQGVQRGDGVFSSSGVIGTVHNVSNHYAVVKSCLTEDINIALMIEPSGEIGLLKWDGKDPRRGSLTGVSNDSKVKKWSKVVTRGSAGIFPPGLPVGKVESSVPIEGKPLWDITILFSENYRTAQRAYVVKNLLRDEQHELESQVPQQNEQEE